MIAAVLWGGALLATAVACLDGPDMPAIYHASEWVEAIAGGSRHGQRRCYCGGDVIIRAEQDGHVLVEVVRPEEGGGTECKDGTLYVTTKAALEEQEAEWRHYTSPEYFADVLKQALDRRQVSEPPLVGSGADPHGQRPRGHAARGRAAAAASAQ